MSMVIPDIEAAVIAFLLDDQDLADVVADRIYPELPAKVVYPCVTVRVISGRGASSPRWLEAATLSISGWGHHSAAGARRDARDACEYAVAAMAGLANTTSLDAVICGPLATLAHGGVPAQVSPGVTNPRFITDVSLTYHPAPAGS